MERNPHNECKAWTCCCPCDKAVALKREAAPGVRIARSHVDVLAPEAARCMPELKQDHVFEEMKASTPEATGKGRPMRSVQSLSDALRKR